MTPERKLFSRRSFYFLLASFVGLIGSLICVGGVLHQVFQRIMITQDEYFVSQYGYTYDQCMQGPYNAKTEEYATRTDAEIDTCKQEQKANVLLSRSVNFKKDLIGFSSWGFLFIILLVTHLPTFLKGTKHES